MKQIFLILILSFSLSLFADEGMWTFDNPPKKQLKEKYNFEPTQEWLDHIRLASVRFNDGGSGSFISPDGLVLTNHHVARGQLQKLSSAEKDYVKDGFYAKTREDEIKTKDLELNVLVAMKNVTDEVLGGLDDDLSPKEALEKKRAIIAEIEKKAQEDSGLRSDVVSLYHGGEYWLYQYKKYTDVRLVFAPEVQAAYYGGDYDNFTYPRYDLDFTILRVYENDKPVHPEAYLKWNTAGAEKDELVFVSGNPGSTNRLQTVAQLKYQRDFSYPYRIERFKALVKVLEDYSARGPEEARQARGFLFGINNGLKAWGGEYKGLLNEKVMRNKEKEEKAFREKIAANPEWQKKYGDAWEEIEKAEKQKIELIKPYMYSNLGYSKLARFASQIVTYVEEVTKPDGERLPGYHDSQLNRVKFYLFSPAPVYKEMDKVLMKYQLNLALEKLDRDNEFIRIVLGDKSPDEVVDYLLDNTKLADPEFRKKLIEGGKEAVDKCKDPLIVLARKLDPIARKLNKKFEDEIASIENAASEKIAEARFKVYGKSVYPDATFTLRLSYGTVKGYEMNGTIAPPFTTLYGLFDRAYSFEEEKPFDLPKTIAAHKDDLNLKTRVNFVSTCDIIGGNSGSPVINRNGELVGLIFDGNIESLIGRYVYDIEHGRAVAVHPAYIIEALRKAYGAGKLADEIEGK